MHRCFFIWGLLFMTLLAGCNLWHMPPSKLSSGKAQAGVTLENVPVGNMTDNEVRQSVMQIAAAQNQDPVDAGFMADAAGFTPEKDGRTVNVAQTVAAVLAAPANTAVHAVVSVTKPKITVQKLQTAQLVGQAETPLRDKAENRIHNIRIAAHDITNTILMQGETFSFNEVIGKAATQRGYREAPIIENGQTIQGLGGGVCQISSTLYSAVLAGRLPVVERHPHSKPVDYIREGLDATTSDDKDFKFRSNRRGLLILRVLVTPDAVRTEIWEIGAGD